MFKFFILSLFIVMFYSCSSVQKMNRIDAQNLSSAKESYLFIYPIKYFSGETDKIFKYSAILSDYLSDSGVESVRPFCYLRANSLDNLYSKNNLLKQFRDMNPKKILYLKTEIEKDDDMFILEMSLLNSEEEEIVYLVKKSSKLEADLLNTAKIMLRFLKKIRYIKKLYKKNYNPYYINFYNPLDKKDIKKTNENIDEMMKIMHPKKDKEKFKKSQKCITVIN